MLRAAMMLAPVLFIAALLSLALAAEELAAVTPAGALRHI